MKNRAMRKPEGRGKGDLKLRLQAIGERAAIPCKEAQAQGRREPQRTERRPCRIRTNRR